MKFLKYDLTATAGDIVEVVLQGNAANVMLLDSLNFQNYQSGRPFKYFGGHYKMSPVRIAVPSTGQWHLVVDLGGAPGHISASVRVIGGQR